MLYPRAAIQPGRNVRMAHLLPRSAISRGLRLEYMLLVMPR